MEYSLEKGSVGLPGALTVELVDVPRGPGEQRRVYVAEGPLVGGDLAVGVLVPLASEQYELLLGEAGIDERKRYAVERQVPGREPRVLPLVGHRDDVGCAEVDPVVVAPTLPARGRRGLGRVALQPSTDVVVVELLRPQEAGERLALYAPLVLVEACRLEFAVELVGVGKTGLDGSVHLGEKIGGRRRGRTGMAREAHAQHGGSATGDRERVVRGRLGAALRGVHGLCLPFDDRPVEGILHPARCARRAEESLDVGLVLREKKPGLHARHARAVEPGHLGGSEEQLEGAQRRVLGEDRVLGERGTS